MFIKLSIGMIILALGCAQVPFPNTCPDVKIPEEFDVDAYMGIWFEYSKYPFLFEIGKKCMYARYTNKGNDTVYVVNTAVNRFTNSKSNVTGTAKILGPGQLAVKFSKNQSVDKPNYLVLGTDYTSYALVYSCTNFSTVAHTKNIWILTRERKPTNSVVDAAKKVMDDNNLLQAFLIDTAQDDCPESDTTQLPDYKLSGADTKAEMAAESNYAPAEIVSIAFAGTDSESVDVTLNGEQPNLIDKA
ncbi:apolipoprotein D-like [Teleopsis dalmanni]|uniref:apolipoprotein D-like n=1 Tax=Teleopsis dalmanni TaxID=139649 RepID=UPI000D32D1ED|nr:apolipoprotein D-like [Teleopsis dalmanni]